MKTRMLLGFLLACLLVTPAVAQPNLSLIWENTCAGELRQSAVGGVIHVECWDENAPPVPTATPTATAEPGATPTVAPTVAPTVTLTPTLPPEPTPTATPDPGVPMCTHDPLLWHDLYDEVRNCRFGHEHGDDPNLVNDIFGPPGAWYGAPGTELGGPNFPVHEMAAGHPFLKWYVHTDIPPNRTEAGPAGWIVRAIRVHMHAATYGTGIKHRFHGFEAEVLICTVPGDSRVPETCGIARYAGVGDYGNLRWNNQPEGLVLLPSEPDGQDVDLGLMGLRNHPTLPQINAGQWPGVTWYQRTWCAQDGSAQNLACMSSAVMINDPWQYITPIPGDVQLGLISGAGFNGSNRELHIVASDANQWAFPSGIANLQWVGGVDGLPNPSCTALGQQGCAYVVLENVPSGYMRYAVHSAIITEYDTSPPGQSWIGIPN